SRSVTLPASGAGQRYLLFVTDASNQQGEANESNNLRSVAITVIAPDLAITDTSSPADAVLGQPISFSWTVTNQGTVPANADWRDRVYLSRDAVVDGNDLVLVNEDESGQSPLANGASYTSPHTLTLSGSLTGDVYLLFVTD